MEKYLEWLESNDIPATGPIMTGIIHLHLENREKLTSIYETTRIFDGNIIGNYGIGKTKKDFLSEEEKEKFKKLKRKYNPDGILNRGNII